MGFPLTLAWCVALFGLVVRHEESVLLARYGEELSKLRGVGAAMDSAPAVQSGAGERTLAPLVFVGAPLLLVLLPFVVKEFLSPWLEP